MSKTKRQPKRKTRRTKDGCFVLAEDYRRLKDDAVKDAMMTFFQLMIAIPLNVMHKHYGWGVKKRLPELAELLCTEINDLSRLDGDPETYVQRVAPALGLKIDVKPGRAENE